jgi:hypothetical protein
MPIFISWRKQKSKRKQAQFVALCCRRTRRPSWESCRSFYLIRKLSLDPLSPALPYVSITLLRKQAREQKTDEE